MVDTPAHDATPVITLDPNPAAALPDDARALLPRLNLRVSRDDAMYHGNDTHYLACGASALAVVRAGLALANAAPPRRVLDFGSGAGRVTRWLQAAYPAAVTEACDVRAADVRFCGDELGALAWLSATDIEAIRAPAAYDVIWAGSVLTHLDADTTRAAIARWTTWLHAGGLLVATLHGRRAVELAATGRLTYIDSDRWATVLRGFREHGYGYAPYPGTPGYGVSLTAPAWSASLVASSPDLRLVALSERVWDDHQDALVVQRTG
jgi:SAM-dependent methyltransferase